MTRDRVDRTGEMGTFLSVVREGSLSAAGRALDLTPSAVSRVIARLESRLGVKLIVTTTRSLRLTAEGEAFARSARRILDDITEAEEAVASQGAPRGKVRISMSVAHGRLILVPIVADFAAHYPGISVDMELSDELSDVVGGKVDIAIRSGPLADSPLTARRLGDAGRVVVASPAYLARAGTPRAPHDLAGHNCLDFSFRRAEPGWPFREGDRDYLLPVSGNITSNNGEALVQLAKDGRGITRVGEFHVREEIADGRLVPVLERFNPGDREAINALFVGGAGMPARVRALVDFLVSRMDEIRQRSKKE